MKREQAINRFLDNINDEDLVISTTGKTSRELWELRKQRNEATDDFCMMGSMGLASAIGLGVALGTKKQVYVLDGDGAILMHLGNLATIKKYAPKNFHHIILNNDSYDSTGGQLTTFSGIKNIIKRFCKVIDVEKGARKDLGRPTLPPSRIKQNFQAKCLYLPTTRFRPILRLSLPKRWWKKLGELMRLSP